ncbi:MAG: serine protease [Deltaproteobacteria bacterium]|nr:MAG: serine protease [Deltaproteobacteria bacterium]
MNASVRLLEETLPATVHLRVQVPETHPSAAVLGTERAGTGTLVDPGGLVLTVNYVVLGARSAQVTLVDGRELVGDVIAQDFASGVALLKVPAVSLPSLTVRTVPEIASGDEVFILASVGDGGRRASSGAVTSVGPFDANWEYVLERAIFTTAMNPGLGGGPLIDVRGQIVGVVSLNLNEIGRFSLSIPIECYRDHREELLRYGRRPSRPSRAWLGLYCYTLRNHVVIAGLLAGAPGDQAGLAQGDVVLAIDDQEVASRRELYERLWSHRAGEPIVLRVYRNGEMVTVEVTSGDVEEFFA